MTAADFKAARDLLFAHRADYAAAKRAFRWPALDRFNWALDWFDAELAAGARRDAPALIITGEGAATRSFGELSARSNRVANGLRTLGVVRGDRILLMLGNVSALWEVTLAAMKLGAVVIPATTLLTGEDLADRFGRGRAKHVVAAAAEAAKFQGLADGITRIAVGAPVPGWHAYDSLLEAPEAFAPVGVTRANDPLLLYFTSGTTARPKLVMHSQVSYPVGHLTTMYQLGLQPGDVHLNISSPGWAKHAWSCLFAPWNAEAAVFIHNQPRFAAKGMLEAIAAGGVTTLCAPPTVWRMFIQEDLRAIGHTLREVCSAGEPLNPEVMDQVRAAWGLTVRDFYGQTETTAQIGNPPGVTVKPGSMGVALPGYDIRLLDPDGNEAADGEVS
ncbi:MAG: AMP-binding protein, partial [Rhodospirillales bacterium]|nr:AMP-binding protein [Rhodospirillales bacterium]